MSKPDFLGSAPLKVVLPVFVPHMTREGMAVSEGIEVQAAWRQYMEMAAGEEKLDLGLHMSAYITLDTGVILYRWLVDLV